jgi:predicted ABC-type sugar transport system permease subunit
MSSTFGTVNTVNTASNLMRDGHLASAFRIHHHTHSGGNYGNVPWPVVIGLLALIIGAYVVLKMMGTK